MSKEVKVALIGGVCIIIAAILGMFSFNINIEKKKLNEDNEILLAENESLKTNITNLEMKLSQYEYLEEENDELKIKLSNLETEKQELLKEINNSSKESIQEDELILDTKNDNVSIRQVLEFYSDGIQHRKGTITDNIGNSYDGYTFMSASDGVFVALEGSVVYRNNLQYSRLFGRVIIDEVEKDIEICGSIKIYGDDILLFDSGVMGRGIEPVDFDLDILNYNKIKICFKNGEWSSKECKYPYCYLVDTYFN